MYVTTSQTGSPLMPYVLSADTSPTVTVSRGALGRTTAFHESLPSSTTNREVNPLGSEVRQTRAAAAATEMSSNQATPTAQQQQRPWLTAVSEREDDDDTAPPSVGASNPSGTAAAASKNTRGLTLSPETVLVPTTTITLASVTNVVSAVSQAAHENLVQWRRPSRPVVFREWYISRYCNEQQVRWIEKMQHICRPIEPFLVRYFQLWSLTGEAEFYTLFIPTVVWLGLPLDGVQIGSLLCVGQYVTGTLKDSVCCPRPPCPPLQLRGKRDTHDNEYGFPSTHSSHSGVFSYFLYCELLRLFPEHGFLCWLAAVYYFANVSFSRIYLGMHWIGDLIGGWVVAFFSILFHVAFLDHWEAYIITWKNPPWWAFLLLYITFHVLSMAHATPHDPCPCYVDSLRFCGVMIGSCLGFWCFYSTYGTLSARAKPEHLGDVLFSWSFLGQWATCIIIVFASKELSSLVAGVVLKYVFKALAGVYAMQVPRPLRSAYLAVAKAVGWTTLGNEKGSRRYIPFTANNSFSFMRNGSFSDASNHEGNSGNRGATAANANAAVRGETPAIEEPDGYISSQQVWSLRTHRHWWLWDVHKRSISYAVTGFVIVFVCQMLLHEWFGVEQTVDGHAAQPIKPVSLL